MKKRLIPSSKTLIILLMFFTISCVPVKNVSYFNDINELSDPVVNPRVQKMISPFDRLYIKIFSTDPLTNQIFEDRGQIPSSANSNSLISYLVDDAGNINFPFTGKINVIGLTTSDAAKKIQAALNEYVSSTSVTVMFVDNQVSILGEVQQQGVYTFMQDKLTIYEALALGGGITRYGNRTNVVLIRQEGEKIMHHKLNLSDSKIAGKSFYYVLPNDVVVVEPLKSVSSSYINNTYITILSSITTLTAVLLLMSYYR
jgi:polysaccharide biosynthesis/export protein